MNNADSTSPPPLKEAFELLVRARAVLEKDIAREDPLTRVALHLIDCTVDVSTLLTGTAGGGDLTSAHDALASARSAVVAATYAVRHSHDRERQNTTRA